MIKIRDLQPLGDHVAIVPVDVETRKGLVYIPDIAKDASFVGDIVAVGKLCETGIRVGDRVIFPKYGGSSIEIGDKEVIFVPETDLLALVKQNA